jgi:hypothetical protein
MADEEKKYKNLIKDLNDLPKVETPKNFETELWRKISSKSALEKKSFWENLISPSKLIPVAGVASAIIIFFLVETNSEPIEDPFNALPRLREDIVAVEEPRVEVFEQIGKAEEKRSVVKKDKEGTLGRDKLKGIDSDKKDQSAMQRNESLFADEMEAQKPQAESLKSEISEELSFGSASPAVTTYSAPVMEKQNLNFRQINLSEEQKKEVEQLKQKIQTKEAAKSK